MKACKGAAQSRYAWTRVPDLLAWRGARRGARFETMDESLAPPLDRRQTRCVSLSARVCHCALLPRWLVALLLTGMACRWDTGCAVGLRCQRQVAAEGKKTQSKQR